MYYVFVKFCYQHDEIRLPNIVADYRGVSSTIEEAKQLAEAVEKEYWYHKWAEIVAISNGDLVCVLLGSCANYDWHKELATEWSWENP